MAKEEDRTGLSDEQETERSMLPSSLRSIPSVRRNIAIENTAIVPSGEGDVVRRQFVEVCCGPVVDIHCGRTVLGCANYADYRSPTSQVLPSSGVADTMRDVFTESDADDLASLCRDRSEAVAASERLGVHAVPEAS